jgi:uncharacterized protein YndB with AHSA1/START domain
MSDSEKGRARAVPDLDEGLILASVEIAAPARRVFRALSSEEVIHWWVRSGVFDTRKWNGDLRIAGRWSASGVAMGNPYSLEGEFTVVEIPRTLAHNGSLWDRPKRRPRSAIARMRSRVELALRSITQAFRCPKSA